MWSISDEKAGRILPVSLLETQQLLGSLNDVGKMCPFLRGFRHPLQKLLTEFGKDTEIRRELPDQARKDLRVWATAIGDTVKGLPIPHRPMRCVRKQMRRTPLLKNSTN
jgi:hypothetical protein